MIPLAAALRAEEAAEPAAPPDPDPWPRVIEKAPHTVKIHPPQVESWDGRQLMAQSAVEVIEKGQESPTYGVVDFQVRTRVDKEARLVVIDEFQSLSASFPARPEAESKLLGFLQQRFQDHVKVVSLDRLETALTVAEQRARAEPVQVANDPPAIVLSETPALLVYVDGEPVWARVEGTAFERVLNTRPLILKSGAGTHYLHLFDGWMSAPALTGPWKVAASLPSGLDAAAKEAAEAQPTDLLDGGSEEVDEEGQPIEKPTLAKGPVPAVIVATTATELVVLDGAPEWVAIPGTQLEFVENTTGNVFRTGTTFYALLSGRWFRASSLDGPWSHVPQANLAPDFAKIPDTSPKENVKASVAGTPQAEEALIANSIPETAEVRRDEARFEPTIDGEPRYEPIEGTTLTYVKNSPTPIVRVAPDTFYAVHNGVWFLSPAAAGPYIVAVQVPDVIYTIPASSPLHFVTYVRIYDANDDVVVTGYTPGYYGTVATQEVVVYGTGYPYSPWVGSRWYGYPATYGYGCAITYTPWGGWSFSFGVGWGWGYWGSWYAPYHPPYWGPYWGYHPYRGGVAYGARGGWAAWGPGGWAGTTGNVYRQWGPASSVSRYSGGYDAWSGTAWRSQVGGAYNSRTGTLAAGHRGSVANVYTGEYAYGGRGVARNPRTGTTVGGGRVTVGDVDTGRQVTGGRVGGYNPRTGEAGSAGWVRGDQGGVARVGDDYYGFKDGSVYRHDGQSKWSQVERSGQWSEVRDPARTRQLDRHQRARSTGQQRYRSHRSATPRARAGGRARMRRW